MSKVFSREAAGRGEAFLREKALKVTGSRGGDVGFLSGRVVEESFCAVARIEWTRSGVQHQCNCQAFRSGEKCAHLYALLLEAEGQQLLPGTLLQRSGKEESPPNWALELQRIAQQPLEDGNEEDDLAAGELVYLLRELPEISEESGLRVSLARKQGEEITPIAMAPAEVNSLVDAEDRRIFTLLAGAGSMDEYEGFTPRKEFTIHRPSLLTVLPELCATGKAYWQERGATRPVVWDSGGTWRLVVQITGGETLQARPMLQRNSESVELAGVHLLAGGAVVLHEGRLGQVWGPVNERLLDQLPLEVPRAAADLLLKNLAAIPGGHELSWPPELNVSQVQRPCVPVLNCALVTTRSQWITEDVVTAELEFAYGPLRLSERGGGRLAFDEPRRVMVQRNPLAEARHRERLRELGFRFRFVTSERKKLMLSPERFREAALVLGEEGWQIEGDGLPRYAPAGEIELRVSSGIDWLELDGEIAFGQQKVKLPALLKAMGGGQRFYDLPGGGKAFLESEQLRPLWAIARAFRPTSSEPLRFAPSQAALLEALISTTPRAQVDQRFGQLRSVIAAAGQIAPQEPPAGFVGELRSYQKQALGWFSYLRQYRFGGCLADDMGLGKTVQVLALLEERRQARHVGQSTGARPTLVVAPRSLIFNWLNEAAKFTPLLKTFEYTGAGRAEADLDQYDLVITTYGTLRQDALVLARRKFDYVILDEAQAIKNAGTATARSVRVLEAEHRLALSGTPVENHLGELVSLFEFLNPGMLPASMFADSSKGMDSEFAQLLARALRPFILRRTKQQVAPELPERTEQTIFCELDEQQRKEYDELKLHYQRMLLGEVAQRGMNQMRFQVLEALLRLRQAACHPGLLQPQRRSEGSAKLDAILEQIDEITEEGHKVLVFSQFVSMLSILRSRLDERKIGYEYLDGQTGDRQAPVQRFQNDESCKLFLISLKAGGVGLNLTAAEYVLLLDPWWNPAVEAQAIDRAHRIGQTRQVFAYRLIAKDTVEEKVLALQARKRELADAILGEEAGGLGSLTPDDLQMLLA